MDITRIDVHHHILPHEIVSTFKKMGITEGLGVPLPEWTPNKSLAFMKKHNIAAAVTSMGIPGTVNPAQVQELARSCNEYAASLKHEYPVFASLACLPLPDVAAAVDEFKYALNDLELDGVGLFTHYNGTYLGDKKFDPLFRELNRKKAVVFIHPIDPPQQYNSGLTMPAALIEAPFETTRAVTNLLYTGTTDQYPHIKYILSHGGGTIPYLAWRLALVQYIQENKKPSVIRALYDFYIKKGPHKGLETLKKMYYDTALTASDPALKALHEFSGAAHILFGTDYPFAAHLVPYVTKDLEKHGFSQKDFDALYCGNFLELFPHLKSFLNKK
jgi:predicted TIM-barrel fold metal-dependent hydrolase